MVRIDGPVDTAEWRSTIAKMKGDWLMSKKHMLTLLDEIDRLRSMLNDKEESDGV